VEYDGDHHRTEPPPIRQRRSAARDAGAEWGWIIVRVVAEDRPADILRRVREALAPPLYECATDGVGLCLEGRGFSRNLRALGATVKALGTHTRRGAGPAQDKRPRNVLVGRTLVGHVHQRVAGVVGWGATRAQAAQRRLDPQSQPGAIVNGKPRMWFGCWLRCPSARSMAPAPAPGRGSAAPAVSVGGQRLPPAVRPSADLPSSVIFPFASSGQQASPALVQTLRW